MPADERWVDPEQPERNELPHGRIHNYGKLEDIPSGSVVGVDHPTVELASKAMVDTAIVISEAYKDPNLKAADVLMFLVSQTNHSDNTRRDYTSPELQELMDSDAFKKYHVYLKNTVSGKRADQKLAVRLVGGTGTRK